MYLHGESQGERFFRLLVWFLSSPCPWPTTGGGDDDDDHDDDTGDVVDDQVMDVVFKRDSHQRQKKGVGGLDGAGEEEVHVKVHAIVCGVVWGGSDGTRAESDER